MSDTNLDYEGTLPNISFYENISTEEYEDLVTEFKDKRGEET
jgi:hypothetical protein